MWLLKKQKENVELLKSGINQVGWAFILLPAVLIGSDIQ